MIMFRSTHNRIISGLRKEIKTLRIDDFNRNLTNISLQKEIKSLKAKLKIAEKNDKRDSKGKYTKTPKTKGKAKK